MDHELVRLAPTINWDAIAAEFRPMYCPDNGRPAVPTRLMAGLQLLKHTFNLSDEQVVAGWTENPYWQFFCGEEFFCHKLPINPCQMTRWRQRIGEKGVEKLLQITIEAGKATKTMLGRAVSRTDGNRRHADGCPVSLHRAEGELLMSARSHWVRRFRRSVD